MSKHSPSLGGRRQPNGHAPAFSLCKYIPEALDLLHNPETRSQGMAAFARMGEAAMLPLLDLLHHDDPALRRAAASTLGRVLDSRWTGKLVRAAHWTFHARREADGPARMMAALISGSPPTRAACAVALGRMGERGAVPELIELLRGDHRLTRLAAIWALGRIGDQVAIPHLEDALEEEDRVIREMAGEALAQIDRRNEIEKQPHD